MHGNTQLEHEFEDRSRMTGYSALRTVGVMLRCSEAGKVRAFFVVGQPSVKHEWCGSWRGAWRGAWRGDWCKKPVANWLGDGSERSEHGQKLSCRLIPLQHARCDLIFRNTVAD